MKYLQQLRSVLYYGLIFQLCFLKGYCQGDLNAISAVFSQYHQNSIEEKIFVHSDKNFYVAGEIAWFKLYVVSASTHKPMQLSKVAYVEILDSANKPLLQAKIALINAEGNGSFYLPLTINSGNYKLRAYTNWMKNFGVEYFFENNITIVNTQKTISLSAPKPGSKFDFQFFPEGGNLVNNLASVVAFKCTDEYGIGVPFTGVLLDNNDTVLKFKPAHAGMGSFHFTPLSNHTYKAFIQTSSGESLIKDMPAAYSGGYTMSLADSAEKIKVTVQTDNLPAHEIYLFAHTREIIKTTLSTYLENGKAIFIFDKNVLGDGISHITIFNDRKQPVCERLYFKKPSSQLKIKLSADEPVYATRKKVSIAIQADAAKDSSSLSMTVYRVDSLQSINAATIESYLFLTSDIKGFVEDPNYYFSSNDAETNAALDYVMLTNGWRRFKWETVFKNTKPLFAFVPEYNGAIVTGNVINTNTGKPSAKIETFLAVPGLSSKFRSSVSDNDGKVAFELKNLYGSSEIIVQPNTFVDSIYRVDINDPFSKDFSGTPIPSFSLKQNNVNALQQQSISMQVQNIYSGKKLRRFLVPAIDTTPFYISGSGKYALDNYTRFTTIEEVLREYVILVDVRKKEGAFLIKVFDSASQSLFKNDPLILIDGVPVFDVNKFMRLDPLKLNTLEVLMHKYFLGYSIFDGVLNWTTYKTDMADYDFGSHATVIDYDGLQIEREFYSPAYSTEDIRSNHLPDFRNVLLWSPNIKIASGQTKELNFYTSDVPGKYAVQIEGLSNDGMCGSSVLTFEVKK